MKPASDIDEKRPIAKPRLIKKEAMFNINTRGTEYQILLIVDQACFFNLVLTRKSRKIKSVHKKIVGTAIRSIANSEST